MFTLKGDVWHNHCFFPLEVFTADETEDDDDIGNKGKLTNYIQGSSKTTNFITYDFFYFSLIYETKHHFVVQKITSYILTVKKLHY
jgi:hypothetical protein